MSLSKAVQSKRGYLANILTLPPLIYPFQYNPTELTDAKRNTLGKKTQICPDGATVEAKMGKIGRMFSNAQLHTFESEGDRTINFKFVIDGREQRPGEPARRRTEGGDILYDLAILRSFMYPQILDLLDLLGAASSNKENPWTNLWFNEPPTALLVLGDLVMEGFVTDLSITETLFNAELNPVRAEVTITLTEKLDSFTFVLDSVKRLSRNLYASAYEDIGNVIL